MTAVTKPLAQSPVSQLLPFVTLAPTADGKLPGSTESPLLLGLLAAGRQVDKKASVEDESLARTVDSTETSLMTTTTNSLTLSRVKATRTQTKRDTTAPLVNWSAAPANGATVSGAVPLSATATDNVAVVGVQFLVNGTSVGAEDTDPSNGYSVTWNTATVANGSYTLTARARDATGNTTTSSTRTVTVANADVTAPTVAVTAPTGPVSGTVSLRATASDNVGVSGVQFLVNGTPVGAEDTTSPYGVSFNTATVANGTYAVTARARDAAGNTTLSAPVTITVQSSSTNSGPVIYGTPHWSSPDWTTGQVTGGVTFLDPDGDPLTYTVTNGPANGTVTLRQLGGLTSFTYTPTLAARQAAYQTPWQETDSFTITASDGQATASIPFTVTLAPLSPDNHAPALQGDPTMSVDLNTGRVYGSFTVVEPDGDQVSYSYVEGPDGDVAIFGSSGPATTYTYNFIYYPTQAARDQAALTPGPDTATFYVTVRDGRGGTTSFTVTMPLEPRPNDMPVWQGPTTATFDPYTGRTTGNLNVFDPDGDPLAYGTSYGPWYGTLTIDSATGNYVYVPYLNADQGMSSYEIVTVSIDDGTYVTHQDWWVQTYRNDLAPL